MYRFVRSTDRRTFQLPYFFCSSEILLSIILLGYLLVCIGTSRGESRKSQVEKYWGLRAFTVKSVYILFFI